MILTNDIKTLRGLSRSFATIMVLNWKSNLFAKSSNKLSVFEGFWRFFERKQRSRSRSHGSVHRPVLPETFVPRTSV